MPKANTTGRRWLGRILVAVGCAVVLVAVLWFVVAESIARAIVRPERSGVAAPVPEGLVERRFVMADGVEIRAWECRPVGKPSFAILVLHGVGDSKASQAETLRLLSRRGVLAVAPDFRAHGDSGGAFATYGFVEKHDLSAIRREIEGEWPGIRTGLWGTSYGAAAALQAMGNDADFRFAIVRSTFADLRDLVRNQVERRTSLPVGWIGPLVVGRAGALASFDPTEIAPERAMERIQAPILHLHGGADELIPLEHGERIAGRARDPNYRFVAIPRGDHNRLRAGDPAAYDREVSAFLDRVLGAAP